MEMPNDRSPRVIDGVQMMSRQPMGVECRAVSVGFLDRQNNQRRSVLDGLDFTIQPAKIVSLLGKSGCGKSTLLRAIAGLQAIDAGEIRIGQESIAQSRSQVSFVFQEPALLPWRTAIENVFLPLELVDARRSAKTAEIRQRAIDLLNTVDFQARDFEKFPSQLSGGMKMRVSLARALVTEPSLLLLDEPFAALDDMLRWRLNEWLLEQVSQHPKTIVFVTHNIAEAIFISQKIAIMHQGRIAEWLESPLPEQRHSQLRSTPEFAQFYGEVGARLARHSANPIGVNS
jgi:NitT/TauT family transport system ATP-binding protein